MGIHAVGIDVVDIARFRTLLKKKQTHFFRKTFTPAERDYCISFKDSAPHFAGTFAAKEAVLKVLGDRTVPLAKLEIRREKTGKPHVWLGGRKSRNIFVSITHDGGIACAIAFKS